MICMRALVWCNSLEMAAILRMIPSRSLSCHCWQYASFLSASHILPRPSQTYSEPAKAIVICCFQSCSLHKNSIVLHAVHKAVLSRIGFFPAKWMLWHQDAEIQNFELETKRSEAVRTHSEDTHSSIHTLTQLLGLLLRVVVFLESRLWIPRLKIIVWSCSPKARLLRGYPGKLLHWIGSRVDQLCTAGDKIWFPGFIY